jgi:hypothetical protein
MKRMKLKRGFVQWNRSKEEFQFHRNCTETSVCLSMSGPGTIRLNGDRQGLYFTCSWSRSTRGSSSGPRIWLVFPSLYLGFLAWIWRTLLLLDCPCKPKTSVTSKLVKSFVHSSLDNERRPATLPESCICGLKFNIRIFLALPVSIMSPCSCRHQMATWNSHVPKVVRQHGRKSTMSNPMETNYMINFFGWQVIVKPHPRKPTGIFVKPLHNLIGNTY